MLGCGRPKSGGNCTVQNTVCGSPPATTAIQLCQTSLIMRALLSTFRGSSHRMRQACERQLPIGATHTRTWRSDFSKRMHSEKSRFASTLALVSERDLYRAEVRQRSADNRQAPVFKGF